MSRDAPDLSSPIPDSESTMDLLAQVRRELPAHAAIVASDLSGRTFWGQCRCGWKGGGYFTRMHPQNQAAAHNRQYAVEKEG